MKKILFFPIFILCFCFLTFPSCSKKGREGEFNKKTQNEELVDKTSSITNIITIKPGKKIKLDTPQKFVELWILFNLEQKKWLRELSTQSNIITNTDENFTSKILEEKRKAFYQSFGLTEEEFAKYSMENWKKIQDFLEEHPEYKDAYEKSLKE